MKPQDLLFVILFIAALLIKKEKVLVILGLIFLSSAIPLYVGWIFFTANRLVMYAIAFIFMSLIFSFFNKSKLQ